MGTGDKPTLVSILVPVYNAADFLRVCVQSITAQTYTNLQIVLINDGSTDGSWELMKELARDDRRIEVYSQSNNGVAATRNGLLSKAIGDWVLFVDSDDTIAPDTVKILLQEQEKTGADMIVFNQRVARVYDKETVIREFLRHRGFRGMLWNKLLKREHLEGLEFDRSVSFGEDALMVWQVLQRVNHVVAINKRLYHYSPNATSLSLQRFNGKKFTAYTVWNAICNDVDETWPQYSDIAHARFACEMTQVLKSAAVSDYRHDSSVKLLQEEVRRDGHLIAKTGISSRRMSRFAWLVSHSYWLARYVSKRV